MVATPSTSSQTKGVVRQVIGPVLDVEFPAGNSTSRTGPITWRTTPFVCEEVDGVATIFY